MVTFSSQSLGAILNCIFSYMCPKALLSPVLPPPWFKPSFSLTWIIVTASLLISSFIPSSHLTIPYIHNPFSTQHSRGTLDFTNQDVLILCSVTLQWQVIIFSWNSASPLVTISPLHTMFNFISCSFLSSLFCFCHTSFPALLGHAWHSPASWNVLLQNLSVIISLTFLFFSVLPMNLFFIKNIFSKNMHSY